MKKGNNNIDQCRQALRTTSPEEDMKKRMAKKLNQPQTVGVKFTVDDLNIIDAAKRENAFKSRTQVVRTAIHKTFGTNNDT